MKNITTVMASAMLMGATMTAGAGAPDVPSIYSKGPLGTKTSPYLFVQEKVAFALMESAMQAAEGVIYANGCSAAQGTWDINTEVFDDGKGSLEVSSNGVSQLNLSGVASALTKSPGGTQVGVKGSGSLKGNSSITQFNSTAYYNTPGAMMVETANFGVKSVNGNYDPLTGIVIKDFWKETSGKDCNCSSAFPIIWDWGLQAILKNYVPQDKWWQRSAANRSDGEFGRTVFRKDRLYSAKNGGSCSITIDMKGTNDADFFGQSGTLVIKK